MKWTNSAPSLMQPLGLTLRKTMNLRIPKHNQ